MERFEKLELIKRSLGIRHKLKVHDSIKTPETHEELALMLLAKWELEDELRAIEEMLAENRTRNVQLKKERAVREYLAGISENTGTTDEPSPGNEADEPAVPKAKKKPAKR